MRRRGEAAGRDGIDEQVGDVVAGIAVRAEHLLAVDGRVERSPRPAAASSVGLGGVDGPVGELVHPADVVAVDVGGDGEQPWSSSCSTRWRSGPRPSDVSTTRSVSRPRTCQTLQRSSGWTCGSVTSVTPSPTPLDHEPRVGDRQVEHRPSVGPDRRSGGGDERRRDGRRHRQASSSAGTKRSGASGAHGVPAVHPPHRRRSAAPRRAPAGGARARRRRRRSRRPQSARRRRRASAASRSGRSPARPRRSASQSWRATSSKPHHGQPRRWRQSFHRAERGARRPCRSARRRPSRWCRRRRRTSTRSRTVPVNVALVAHSTRPSTSSAVSLPDQLGDRAAHRVPDGHEAVDLRARGRARRRRRRIARGGTARPSAGPARDPDGRWRRRGSARRAGRSRRTS